MHTKRIWGIAVSTILVLGVLCGSASYLIFTKANILVNRPDKHLAIPPGTRFGTLRDRLYQEGYVAGLFSFCLVARLLGYDRKIIPGLYHLKQNMSNWQAIKLLRAGIQKPIRVTFHQVKNKAALADKLTQRIALQAADFEKLLNDADFVRQYGFKVDNVGVMFIPNTYELYWTISAKGLFERMYTEYKQFWTESRLAKAKQLGLTPIEVSILAAIVQCESNQIAEAPTIAGVYLNRLKRGIKLYACPTLLYALEDASARRVLKKDKYIDSPYNTYRYPGLPPGPITIPTIAMIDAVLNYEKHPYLYFSAKEDFSGHHYFSRTYQEHLHHAKRYQRVLNHTGVFR